MSIRILPRGALARREALWFWFFVSPWVIGFLLFALGPTLASGALSFTDYRFRGSPEWVGLANYRSLWHDDIFWKSLKVSGYYTLLSVPAGVVFSLFLALILNQRVPALSVFRTLFFLPSIMPPVAATLLFVWILNPQFGLVNSLIRGAIGDHGWLPLGVQGPRWLQDPAWVIPSFTLLSLWGVGGSMLIYLSGLQAVPTQLYEAAKLDGAGYWERFRRVTLPMISPVILFTLITGVIGSFQVFSQAWVVNRGSGAPQYASMFYVLYLFNNAFRDFRMGVAAAQAWLLLLVTLGLTLLLLRVSRRFVYYEE